MLHKDVDRGTYLAWQNMNARCNRTTHPQYYLWGGRGIIICERWKSFDNFLKDMGVKPKSKSLDRVNNDLGYSPENCRWATADQQQQNRRNTVYVEHNDKKITLKELSILLDKPYNTVYARYSRKWDINSIVSSKNYNGNNKTRRLR